MQAVRRDLISSLSHLAGVLGRWHRQPEGKIAVYGTLFLFVITVGNAIAARLLSPPTLLRVVEQRAESLKVPCEAQGRTYPYGVRVFVRFDNLGNVARYYFCKDTETGVWVPNEPRLENRLEQYGAKP